MVPGGLVPCRAVIYTVIRLLSTRCGLTARRARGQGERFEEWKLAREKSGKRLVGYSVREMTADELQFEQRQKQLYQPKLYDPALGFLEQRRNLRCYLEA